jgi:ABC-type multidrug transport system ATPase subunit
LELLSSQADIVLKPGIHLLAARNGRGKSTMLRTLAGLQPSLSGEFETKGRMQYVGEGLRFDAELSPKRIFAAVLTREQREFAARLSDDLELDLNKPYGKLSKGNQQKVHIVIAEGVAHGSDGNILLLDEPISNLDYHVRMRLNRYWKEDASGLLRIICMHELEWAPEWESLLLIAKGTLRQYFPKELNLEDLYHQLN